MKLEEIKYTFKNIIHRKSRSFLTVLSILIGVMAIFAIVSFGLGIQDYMEVLGEEAGTDKLFIQSKSTGAPGTDSNFLLSSDEINFISKINGVKEISGMYLKVGEAVFHKEKKYPPPEMGDGFLRLHVLVFQV